MTRFLHISDLHIRSEHNTVQRYRLQMIQERFPDHRILLTGDIVDDGREKQYQQALKLLSSFKERVFCVMGNHDCCDAGNLFNRRAVLNYQQFTQEFGMQYTYKYDPGFHAIPGDPDVLLIGLDSNLHTISPFDFARGDIGKEQLHTLNPILMRHNAGNCPVIILCLHHHPFSRNLFGELRDWKRFMKTIAGQVDMVCFGHKHEAGYWQDRYDIPHILAAGSLRSSRYIWEIVIEKRNISVNEVKL